MTDPRIETLAKNLIGFSCNVQRGENVLIETYGDCDALLLALIRETYAAGANPSFGGGTTPYSARLRWALRMRSLT